MENNKNIKKEIKISKTEEEEKENENSNNEKNNSYSKLANISHIENESNVNEIELEIDNDIFSYYIQENEKENELTQSKIERLNKIREEAQHHSEKYSELSTYSNLIIKNTNNSRDLNNLSYNNIIINNDTNDTMSNLSHNFINNEHEENQNIEINPNLERIFNKIHPYLFINDEPLILILPDIFYFIIIFTITSFLSIIFYSIKAETYLIIKIYICLDIFFMP